VIIGGHPHVIEPVEVLTASDGRRVPCFWSVGNFVSTQVTNEMLVGGVAHVTLEKDADGTCQVTRCSFVPTVTKKGVGTDMSVYLLRDYTDEMAATNYLESNGTDNRDLSRAWAEQFCQEVLGERYSTSDEMIVFGEEEFEPVKQEDKDTKAEKDESSDKKAA
jgi:poly-gamma-glutamate synthesis protein (capsule biosynthesis protein)